MRGLRFGLGLLALSGCPTEGTAVTEGGVSSDGGGGASVTESGETGVPTSGGPTVEPTSGGLTVDSTSGGPTSGESTGSSGGTSTGSPVESSGSTTEAGAACGDGELDEGEGCDDGNVMPDDGCSPGCEPGPGALVGRIEVTVAKFETLWGLAVVDREDFGGASHGLTLVGAAAGVGPEKQVAAHVQQRAADDGALGWKYLEYAGVFGRRGFQAVTAANGDVVVAGQIYTEQVKPDSGGYLWLARFSPAGALVWSVEPKMERALASELMMTAAGDVVLVGHVAGLGGSSSHVYRLRGADGATVWTFTEPSSQLHSGYYQSAAVDAEGGVYTVGMRTKEGDGELAALHVRALDEDGKERWEFERAAPVGALYGTSISVTTDEQLFVVGLVKLEEDGPTSQLFVGLDLEGEPLWSREWSAPGLERPGLGEGVAAPDGGVYLVGSHGPVEARKGLTAHFDAAGLPVWVNPGGSGHGIDLAVDPDGVLRVLVETGVEAYAP